MSGRRSRRIRDGQILMVERGPVVEATPTAQLRGRDRLEAAMARGAADGTHVWTAITQYLIEDPTVQLNLDTENLCGPPMLVCFVCEEAFDPKRYRQRCPGEPPQWQPVPR